MKIKQEFDSNPWFNHPEYGTLVLKETREEVVVLGHKITVPKSNYIWVVDVLVVPRGIALTRARTLTMQEFADGGDIELQLNLYESHKETWDDDQSPIVSIPVTLNKFAGPFVQKFLGFFLILRPNGDKIGRTLHRITKE